MKTNQNYGIVFNSTLLFVTASILQMTLHELGHFIMAVSLQAQNVVLFHNYVSDSNAGLTQAEILLIKGAGPFVSLIIGILFQLTCSRQHHRGMPFLFNLYMSVFGYIGFFGYVMVAPFFVDGDTGSIFNTLGFPIWLTVAIAIVAALVLYLIMTKLIRYFVEMGTREIAAARSRRIPFINSIILFPLFIGIGITTLLNLPVPTALSLIAPLCSPFTIMWTYGQALTKDYPDSKMNSDPGSLSKLHGFWIIMFVMMIILNRILANGISLD